MKHIRWHCWIGAAFLCLSLSAAAIGDPLDERRLAPRLGATIEEPALAATPAISVQSPIQSFGAQTVDVPPIVSAKGAQEPSRNQVIGEGRFFVDGGQKRIDIASLAWEGLEGGTHVARLVVRSRGAAELRVGLQFVKSTSALQVRVAPALNPTQVVALHQAIVTATSDGVIAWTPVTQGDAQLLEFSVDSQKPIERDQVFVVGVSHFTTSISKTKGPVSKSLPVGASLPCQLDVVCVDSIGGLDATAKQAFHNKVAATALLLITTDTGSTEACSGTLINNDYGAILLITAFHCIGSEAAANSLITVWNFQAISCGDANFNPGDFKFSGALLLNANKSLDSALVWLRDLPPPGYVLSAWDAGIAPSVGTVMLGMHHPRGDIKKTSIGTILGYAGAFTAGGVAYPSQSYYSTSWQVGLVEQGSSGSGLFIQPPNSSFLSLVGTLTSGPAGTLSCSAATTYRNQFARLDLVYPAIRKYFKSNFSGNYTDLWGNTSEPGWGVDIQHESDTLFAAWFTYDSTGDGMWLVMSNGDKQPDGSYQGALYQATGTPFNLINGAPAFDLPLTQVGSGSFTFTANDSGTFSYNVNGLVGSKAIKRNAFSVPTTCQFTMASRANSTNYQDLWLNPNEPGWGLYLTHQGDTIFAAWFTYGANRKGMWLVMSNGKVIAPNTYEGTLYRATGRPFNQINGSAAANFPLQIVGTLRLTFQDGQSGTMSYTVDGFSGSKTIQRHVYGYPVSRCQ